MKKYVLLTLLLSCAATLFGQFNFNALRMPAQSPHAGVYQEVGITDVHITYSSPSLNGRDVFKDANLVPKGEKPMPWRAGADENTTLSVSTDVTVNGQMLAAGKYGVHIIVNDDKWTVALNKNNQQWGSYFYNAADDALRIDIVPTEAPLTENLTYSFGKHTNNSVEVKLNWGTKQAAFTIGIDLEKTVLASLRRQLTGQDAFNWGGWDAAAQWCLQNNVNLAEALTWADKSLNPPFAGAQVNSNNLGTKAAILAKLGRKDEADKIDQQVLAVSTPQQLLQRTAQAYQGGDKVKAKATLDYAVRKHPAAWETANAQGFWYRMEGNLAEAIKHYKKAGELCPDANTKAQLATRVKGLEEQLKAKK